jgi:hypothetical protein
VNPSAGTLAAFLLNAVAPSVLDRTLSSGDIAATQLADAARQLVRGITGAAQKRCGDAKR